MLVISSSWLADGHLPTVGVFLAVLSIGCGTWALRSLLPHVRSLAVACKIELPHQGSNPSSLHWELEVLTIGPLEKSQIGIIWNKGFIIKKHWSNPDSSWVYLFHDLRMCWLIRSVDWERIENEVWEYIFPVTWWARHPKESFLHKTHRSSR